jgi:plastocyanin
MTSARVCVPRRMRSLIALAITVVTVPLAAATLDVRVQDARGAGIRDAVVYAIPEGRQLPLAKKTAVMDQKNRMFIPHVLAVQTGTSIRFPNSDDIRHHVYSFSPAKQFQLPLYKGMPAKPLVFPKPGVITLGCNIHDQMNAFIIVVDTPFFAKASDGKASLTGLDSGRYTVRVWYPDMRDEPKSQSITISGDESLNLSFVAGRAAVAPPSADHHAHGHS